MSAEVTSRPLLKLVVGNALTLATAYLGAGVVVESLRRLYPSRNVLTLSFALDALPAQILSACGLLEPLREAYCRDASARPGCGPFSAGRPWPSFFCWPRCLDFSGFWRGPQFAAKTHLVNDSRPAGSASCPSRNFGKSGGGRGVIGTSRPPFFFRRPQRSRRRRALAATRFAEGASVTLALGLSRLRPWPRGKSPRLWGRSAPSWWARCPSPQGSPHGCRGVPWPRRAASCHRRQ